MPSAEFRSFAKEASLLLGLPLILLGGVLLWWHPWEPYPGASAFRRRMRLEAEARAAAVRRCDWRSLRIEVPEGYVLTPNSPLLEVLELEPGNTGHDRWPSRMAFLELDSLAIRRFKDAAANCELGQDRCWTDSVGSFEVSCQRSAGVPDPALPWTPHLECQVVDLGVRMATNAPQSTTLEFLAIFDSAVARVPAAYPGALR